jgi:hypothetical protein
MARQKIGTAIDSKLLYRAKLKSIHEKKHLNDIIEEALAQYLAKDKDIKTSKSIVEETKGEIKADLKMVKEVLEEEGYLEI